MMKKYVMTFRFYQSYIIIILLIYYSWKVENMNIRCLTRMVDITQYQISEAFVLLLLVILQIF